MHPHQAGPSMERLWADDVRRLHALWHRGPPRDDASKPKPSAGPGLGPSSSTPFKKAERRRKRKEEKLQRRAAKKLAEQLSLCSEEGLQASDPTERASSSVIEWPCEPPPLPVLNAGWGDTSQKPAPSSARPLPPTQEEQGKIAALRVQQKALRACQGFLSGEGSSDAEEEEDEEEEEDDQMDEDGDGGGENREGSDYFNFFLGLFEEDSDLRAYYEKNWEKGEFCCLVCEGIGVKAGKKFVDCVALVQHSSSIKKTKRKKAHREFGRAICKVLGWDITRLPSIVLDMGETLGQTMAKATGLQCLPLPNAERLQLDIPRESDQISVAAPEVGGTEHDDHGNCPEADDIEGRLTETLSSGVKSVCEPSPMSLSETRWGSWVQKLLPSVQSLPASQEEQERFAARQVHQKALRTCQEFFSQQGSSDIEEEDEEDDGLMDEDGNGEQGCDGCSGGEDHEGFPYSNFFLDLFEEHGDLRAYFEKNWKKGIFYCLVCGGVGVKVERSFCDCVSLLQHSRSIRKIKEAHRALGRAICCVLGWDVTRIPSIVPDMGETLGQTLSKATGFQDNIPKQDDEITGQVSHDFGTDHDSHIAYPEADDIQEG
ncbi:hypothetical protein Taro_007824 [Colocasia esculenta]|uniref:Uncharacterized protein n=1 Tax=Colocasia esculenta TaxID=4460 RepID=A0A843TW06_COLES|nr:hypothetical protein [Colocasia esculenta]